MECGLFINYFMHINIIKKKIDNLINKKKINGSFNKVLTESEIRDFETEYDVTLPEEYKLFLTEIGNGGLGPNYGLLSLQESIIDFKLVEKPVIDISSDFKYKDAWNESWIDSIDWENDRPELDIVNQYMDVSHISGCLQISHYGHGCTNLLVIKGESKGQIWFDGRADYEGLIPEQDKHGCIYNFFEWYDSWLNGIINNYSEFH